MSTNKVYGDRPNLIPLDRAGNALGLRRRGLCSKASPRAFSIDQSKHSLFGASKVAGDVMAQEYGRYFGMPTCCLRGGCLTGPNHSGVELHGFLSYLVRCNLEGREYKVFGYKGKQVRDNIHSEDVASFMHEFFQNPRVRRGLQSGRRQIQLLLHSGSLSHGGRVQRQAAALVLRGAEPRRRPHLLLQRSAQDEGALSGVGYYAAARQYLPGDRGELVAASGSGAERIARPMRIFIAGICGFAGASLARWFQAAMEGARIFGIDNLSRPGAETNRGALAAEGIQVFHGDVRAPSDLEALPAADWIIDAAANPSVLAGVDGQTSSRQLIEHNLHGTLNLLEYAKRHQQRIYPAQQQPRLLHSAAERAADADGRQRVRARCLEGRLPAGISAAGIAEEFPVAAPVSLYGSTKLASEAMALEYGYAFDFPVWVNRCGVLAGAGQFGLIAQGIFSYWMHAHLARRPLRYIGFGGLGLQVRDAFHPNDLAQPAAVADERWRGQRRAAVQCRRRRGEQHVARAIDRRLRCAVRAARAHGRFAPSGPSTCPGS